MSIQTKFDRAVTIVQGLPKEGPVQPTQEDQLYVSFSSWGIEVSGVMVFFLPVLQALQAG